MCSVTSLVTYSGCRECMPLLVAWGRWWQKNTWSFYIARVMPLACARVLIVWLLTGGFTSSQKFWRFVLKMEDVARHPDRDTQ